MTKLEMLVKMLNAHTEPQIEWAKETANKMSKAEVERIYKIWETKEVKPVYQRITEV